MKTIEVVAAIIHQEGRILATQRRYGEYKGWWEFPGGKVEVNETPEEALRREIREELSANIRVERFLNTVEHDYPTFHLSMRCYLWTLESETILMNEHADANWITVSDFDNIKWLPADIKIVDELKRLFPKWK